LHGATTQPSLRPKPVCHVCTLNLAFKQKIL
jgi:hypothetical protein